MSGLVTLSDDGGGPRGPAGEPPASVGIFAADERTQQVIVRVAGESQRYVLLTPSDGDQCILAAGASNAADLRRSWFGAPEDDPTFSADHSDINPPVPVNQRERNRISARRGASSRS